MSIPLRLTRRFPATIASLLFAVVAAGCASSTHPEFNQVVEPEQLARALNPGQPDDLVVLDVRESDDYGSEHLAGAVPVDIAQWKAWSHGEETGLDHEQQWYERIGALGIDGDDTAVIYDDGRMTEAARLWFILQHFGVARVAVVNGGWPALEPLITRGQLAAGSTPVTPRPTTFRPTRATAAQIALAERDDVLAATRSKTAQVFDTRTREEYFGRDVKSNPRAGHLPEAINLPHRNLLDENGKLKEPDELAALFEKAGFEKGRPIITHCQSGGRASLGALAAERAGYGPVLNYYLSFGDWAVDASCPVVTPASE